MLTINTTTIIKKKKKIPSLIKKVAQTPLIKKSLTIEVRRLLKKTKRANKMKILSIKKQQKGGFLNQTPIIRQKWSLSLLPEPRKRNSSYLKQQPYRYNRHIRWLKGRVRSLRFKLMLANIWNMAQRRAILVNNMLVKPIYSRNIPLLKFSKRRVPKLLRRVTSIYNVFRLTRYYPAARTWRWKYQQAQKTQPYRAAMKEAIQKRKLLRELIWLVRKRPRHIFKKLTRPNSLFQIKDSYAVRIQKLKQFRVKLYQILKSTVLPHPSEIPGPNKKRTNPFRWSKIKYFKRVQLAYKEQKIYRTLINRGYFKSHGDQKTVLKQWTSLFLTWPGSKRRRNWARKLANFIYWKRAIVRSTKWRRRQRIAQAKILPPVIAYFNHVFSKRCTTTTNLVSVRYFRIFSEFNRNFRSGPQYYVFPSMTRLKIKMLRAGVINHSDAFSKKSSVKYPLLKIILPGFGRTHSFQALRKKLLYWTLLTTSHTKPLLAQALTFHKFANLFCALLTPSKRMKPMLIKNNIYSTKGSLKIKKTIRYLLKKKADKLETLFVPTQTIKRIKKLIKPNARYLEIPRLQNAKRKKLNWLGVYRFFRRPRFNYTNNFYKAWESSRHKELHRYHKLISWRFKWLWRRFYYTLPDSRIKTHGYKKTSFLVKLRNIQYKLSRKGNNSKLFRSYYYKRIPVNFRLTAALNFLQNKLKLGKKKIQFNHYRFNMRKVQAGKAKLGLIIRFARSNFFLTLINSYGDVHYNVSSGRLGLRMSKFRRSLTGLNACLQAILSYLKIKRSTNLFGLFIRQPQIMLKTKFRSAGLRRLRKLFKKRRVHVHRWVLTQTRPHGLPNRISKYRRK